MYDTMVEHGLQPGDTGYLLLDTSGGGSSDMTPRRLKQLVLEWNDASTLVIACFDTEVRPLGVFTGPHPRFSLTIYSRGGMQLRPAFEFVQRHAGERGHPLPLKVFILSDGMNNDMDYVPSSEHFRVIWLCEPSWQSFSAGRNRTFVTLDEPAPMRWKRRRGSLEWPHAVKASARLDLFEAMLEWCAATFGPGSDQTEDAVWKGKSVALPSHRVCYFSFKKESHLAAFVLAWQGEIIPA